MHVYIYIYMYICESHPIIMHTRAHTQIHQTHTGMPPWAQSRRQSHQKPSLTNELTGTNTETHLPL